MKAIICMLLLFSQSVAWANNRDTDELGRSLANYQICSQISNDINDREMLIYYQKMLNDIRLSILHFKATDATEVYLAWDKSEKVLLKVGMQNLQKICLSRFDALSRQMTAN
ncbi:hypothetical protein GCM10007916_03300 [Psychromonas marina]|uniref:DUF3718 domain-containing protein n=1 Tax=Psychromonas marina TaxID=88364 RepID=A0ABQ6DWN4_9GAMM|nr:hypothetical protein [Psychromonas marina]GLS89263.1 hypothetical protein GCM10007916_03300 [Psychromonas marina]